MTGATIIIATGGSGGHIYPAIAVATALRELGYTCHFIGGADGMEAEIVPQHGFIFSGVQTGKWARGGLPDPRQLWRAFEGCLQAWRMLRRLKPVAVVGFGGFASLPTVAATRLLRYPLVLHEGNSYPGLVTRVFARHAALTGLSFKEAARWLSKAKTAYVRHPIREHKLSKQAARQQLGLAQDSVVTLVMGGSQGSKYLNEAVPEAYRALSPEIKERLVVLHATGKPWLQAMREQGLAAADYRLYDYIEALTAWAAADVAITRSGISTLSEAAYFAVPLLMVPLPGSAENHQLMNAQAVAAAGAGLVLEEDQRDQLASAWEQLLELPGRLEAARAAGTLSPEGAARDFARLIDDFVHPERGHSIVDAFVGWADPEKTDGVRQFRPGASCATGWLARVKGLGLILMRRLRLELK